MESDYRKYLQPSVISKLSNIELKARFVVEGFIAGMHKSPYHGFSVEFAEHRQYMPGDDLKHLDWKVLARTDRLYIKKYQGDTNAQIHLLVDSSASMGYSSGEVTKLQYAQYLASSLAFLGVRQHDSVGLVAFDEGVIEHVPAASRSGHLHAILGVIERLAPRTGTTITDLLHRTAELLTRRAVVVLISDLYDEPDRIIEGLDHLRFRGNDVIVFHVMDKQELDFDL